MLGFHVNFVQTDGRTDNGKTIFPQIFRYRDIKNSHPSHSYFEELIAALQVPLDKTVAASLLLKPCFLEGSLTSASTKFIQCH